MKVMIQHNWTTGLGDLFCAATEYLNFIRHLKTLGYETELLFSFGNNKFISKNEFDIIFDKKSFNLFDSISVLDNSIYDKKFKGLNYFHTQYGPTTPGQHWWDTYFDVIPEDISYPNYNPQTFLNRTMIPEIFPIFNEKVYQKVNEFRKKLPKNYSYIQIRYWDYTNNSLEKDFEYDIDSLYLIIEKSKKTFHVGSNNYVVLDRLKNLPNVITYEFNDLDLFSNDHSYYYYNKHISNDILLERLYNNLAEMVSISEAQNIFLYTKFSWISNFLYYGMSRNINQFNFKLINNNLDSIYEPIN